MSDVNITSQSFKNKPHQILYRSYRGKGDEYSGCNGVLIQFVRGDFGYQKLKRITWRYNVLPVVQQHRNGINIAEAH